MKKPYVYIARKIDKEGLADLYKHCTVKMHTKQMPPARSELLREAEKADALLTVLTEKVDKELFARGKNLKIVANYAVGFDNIDVPVAEKAGVYVTNTPGDFASSVAEHAMAMILMLSKRMLEGDRYVRAGKYKAWDPILLIGNDVRSKTLGIIGTGRIGSALVQIAKAGFGMDILYYDVVPNKEIEKKYKAKRVSLKELLTKSDAVSLHVPLLPATKHLIGSKELALMKQTAVLVNTARGPVINEKALVTALRKKSIAGAGLDVFEHEPKLTSGLKGLSNVVLTPHIASATRESRNQMGEIATQNILDVLVRGKAPRNQLHS